MTLQDLGNIGEFVSAIAVVASLLYLAVQIRQTRKSLQAAATASASDALFRLNESLVQSREVAQLGVDGAQDLSKLDAVDLVRFDAMLQSLFVLYQDVYRQAKGNLVDRNLWHSHQERLLRYLDLPGIARWWSDTNWRFDPTFVGHVEATRQQRGRSASG